MKLSKYLTLMLLATLFCWGAFFIVLFSVDPFTTTILGFILFYFSLFFALVGVLSLVGFLTRYFFNKHQFITQQITVSFRQSVWFALLVVISLYLQSHKLIAWWNLLILILILAMVEYTFIIKNNNLKQEIKN